MDITFSFEHVAARLVPFDLGLIGSTIEEVQVPILQAPNLTTPRPPIPPITQLPSQPVTPSVPPTNQQSGPPATGTVANVTPGDPGVLAPIVNTGGLIFPFTPMIDEGVNVSYDNIELTHSNESYYSYRNTDNVRLQLSNCIWTCDTFPNAIYTLAVLHFLRSYSYMDFGKQRTGRPPSPMWFDAFGDYAFNRVPCIMEKAQWTWPNDIDYVGIPQPGSNEYSTGQLITGRRSAEDRYTWLPVKFEASISLIVQHAPKYWITWNLEDYRAGRMLTNGRNGFHRIAP